MSVVQRFALRCPGCRARLKAPHALLGRSCRCPGCGIEVVAWPDAPADEGCAIVPPEDSSSADTAEGTALE
jgi:hypothetical protein